MKTSYQQYTSLISKYKKITGETVEQVLARAKMEHLKNPNCPSEFELYAMAMDAASTYSCIKHFFVSDECFLDWIISCTPTLESGCPQMLDDITGGKVCVIHFPTRSKFKCCVFRTFDKKHTATGSDAVFMTFPNTNGCNGEIGCVHYDGRNYFDEGDIVEVHARLFAGLGMYLSCFPEMLKDGPPDDVKHPSHHQYSDIKTIGISPNVRVHSEHGEVTPHFRRGHFRVLNSEHFTKKRFQVVFVKQCFVKGEAATILSPEQA